eukprot:COSAG02_NODE_1905_length_10437_cov_54.532643_4_plen_301_part_00
MAAIPICERSACIGVRSTHAQQLFGMPWLNLVAVGHCRAARYVGLSATYTTDNFLVQDGNGRVSVGGENILTVDEFKKLMALNPDAGGSMAAFHEVIAWALNEVVARSENSAATYMGSHVTQLALDLGTRANADDLPEHLESVGKTESPIEAWDEVAVQHWINGLENVQDVDDDDADIPAVHAANDVFIGRSADEKFPTMTVGECFSFNQIHGSELLQLTGTEVMAILIDGCKGDPNPDESIVGKYKLVARTKRIMANIEQLRKVRGDSYSLSEDRAGQLITSILHLRQKLASLYGFHSQ